MLSLQQSRLLPCTAYLRTGVLDMICVQPSGGIHELFPGIPLPPFPVRHGGKFCAVFPAVTCSYITHRHRKPLPNFSGFAGCWRRTFTGNSRLVAKHVSDTAQQVKHTSLFTLGFWSPTGCFKSPRRLRKVCLLLGSGAPSVPTGQQLA